MLNAIRIAIFLFHVTYAVKNKIKVEGNLYNFDIKKVLTNSIWKVSKINGNNDIKILVKYFFLLFKKTVLC